MTSNSKYLTRLYHIFLKHPELRGRDCTLKENAEAQKSSWGEP